MFAFGGKADIAIALRNVRSKADIDARQLASSERRILGNLRALGPREENLALGATLRAPTFRQ